MWLHAAAIALAISFTQHRFVCGNRCDNDCYVTIETEYGKIRGLRRDADGYDYFSFRNITFAKQPLGKLRFQELQPPEPWSDVEDTIDDGPVCLQRDAFYGALMLPSGMSEACIHANVHVPSSAPIKILHQAQCRPKRHLTPPKPHIRKNQGGLPILVFVHGGGFTFGSGNSDLHGPEYIMRKDVILVTFNYRLRAFGFLSTNTTKIPGNAGLRDVATLLKWVKRNARNFGGNPEDITLGGQSAGGTITHIMSLINEQTTNLFKRIIMMSGTASRTFFTVSPNSAAANANYVRTKLGLADTAQDEIYDILANTPAETLQDIANDIQDMTGLIDFTPVVEHRHENVVPVLPIDPDKMINERKSKPIAKIIGFTDNECYSMKHRFEKIKILDRIKENPLTVLPVSLIFQMPTAKINDAVQQIMKRYFKGEPTLEEYIRLCSDSFFVYPTLNMVEKSDGDIYLYRFTYLGGGSLIMQNATGSLCDSGQGCGGVMHVEDMLYLFKANSYPDFEYTPQDISMQDWVTTMFTNFIKTGKPGAYSKWPPVRKGNVQYLDIRKPLEYKMEQLSDDMLETKYFFDKLYSF